METFNGVVSSAHATHVPAPSGRAYRIHAPSGHVLVTRGLADELQRVLERFAVESGFNERTPVSLLFKPGVVGHHKVGRAADIYAVGGLGLDRWKQRWDEALRRIARAASPDDASAIIGRERQENLGWRLYKALQRYGRWSQPYGYPIQLFGPWTRTEGPWTHISDRLLHAHRDHIHVAK
jgi:hypothetical protein